MVKELTDLAGQHEQIADNMSSIILKDMQTAIQEVKQERKRVNDIDGQIPKQLVFKSSFDLFDGSDKIQRAVKCL